MGVRYLFIELVFFIRDFRLRDFFLIVVILELVDFCLGFRNTILVVVLFVMLDVKLLYGLLRFVGVK